MYQIGFKFSKKSYCAYLGLNEQGFRNRFKSRGDNFSNHCKSFSNGREVL